MTQFRRGYACKEESAPAVINNESIGPSEEQLQFDNADLVHYGLSQLGMTDREVLTLFFLEDLAIQEIAELLEIPLGTVKSRLFKARRELRRILEKESQRNDR